MFLMSVFIPQRESDITKTYCIVENNKVRSFTISYCQNQIQFRRYLQSISPAVQTLYIRLRKIFSDLNFRLTDRKIISQRHNAGP